MSQLNACTVGVIGGGSFGTALANTITLKNQDVKIWCRKEEQAKEINQKRQNSKYLPNVTLSERLLAVSQLQEIIESCALLFLAIPSSHFRTICREIGNWTQGDQIIISTTKGIEAETHLLMSQIIPQETCCLKVGVLSGPNLAKELAAQKPAGTVIASRYQEVIEVVQKSIAGPSLRVYGSSDVFGVELGGALKNIYAIATGMMAALELGDNSKGLLFTRALAEMCRFAAKLGANPITFLGLAGVGDLVATCSSPLSRNFRVGYQLGKGKNIGDAIKEVGEVAEGVNTLKMIHEMSAQQGVTLHVMEAVYQVVYENRNLREVIEDLMRVPQMADVEFSDWTSGLST